MKLPCSLTAVILALPLVHLCFDTAIGGDAVYVGQQTAGRVPMDRIDHAAWNALLQKYVNNEGYVNYSAWHAFGPDRQSLNDYLDKLSQADPQAQASPDARLAFWINAYNAVTVYGILREYPTTSIRNHTAKLIGYNIWQDLQLYVDGQPYSLERIEHEVLRKMREPRIHFAIVCASIGCPRLLNQAYTAADVQQQLDANAKDFFSHEQNFRYDRKAQQFYLSAILKWFGEDFGSSQAAQLKTIAKWLPDQASMTAAQQGTGRVSFLDYNWNLNDQKSRRVVRQ